MRVLLLTPSQVSAGEAITALHTARLIEARGGEARFLASPFTSRFLEKALAGRVDAFSDDLEKNRSLWTATVNSFKPDIILCAEFAILCFSSGAIPLADEAWRNELDQTDAHLVTFDHLGYGQGPDPIFFGPPDRGVEEAIIPPPERMKLLLPCPVQEPGEVAGRRGVPFRYWDVPKPLSPGARRALRRRYLKDPKDYLVFHSVPTWAAQFAENIGHPFYRFLSPILQYYLEDLPRGATVISVNGRELLQPSRTKGVRIRNLSTLPASEYEQLLLAADLVLTENKVSVSLGKAVCGLRPSAVLQNSYALSELPTLDAPLADCVSEMERICPGAVYPHEAFPIWGPNQIDRLRLFRGNRILEGFASLELYGGEQTKRLLHQLMTDEATQAVYREGQQEYQHAVDALPDALSALGQLTGA